MRVSRGTTMRKLMNKRIAWFFVISFFTLSCGIQRQQYTIDDYVLVPNAKEIIGGTELTAFVFENNKKIIPFHQFLAIHYQLQTLNEKEIPFSINEERFTLHVYDVAEMEKYINLSDFVMKEQIPDLSKMGNQSDFVVLSVVNDRNEDCLKEGSLYQNITIQYLKNLKAAYISNDR